MIIPWDPKQFAAVIPFLTKMENVIRLMLMTAQLPTNSYMVHKAHNLEFEPWCEYHECHQQQTQESIEHVLFQCNQPSYKTPRNNLIKIVHEVYSEHNKSIADAKDIICYDPSQLKSIEYLKLFIFPSFKLTIELRVKIIKALCQFIKTTNVHLIQRYLNGLCIRINDKNYLKKYGQIDEDDL